MGGKSCRLEDTIPFGWKSHNAEKQFDLELSQDRPVKSGSLGILPKMRTEESH